MWTCAACGASNEPHAIFCSDCGVLRVKAAPREAYVPVAPLPEDDSPVFRGTVSGFVLGWIGATAGGGALAWFVGLGLSRAISNAPYETFGPFLVRVFMTLAWAVASGLAVGALQAMALSRHFGRARWSRWAWATLAGSFAAGVCWLAIPEAGPGRGGFSWTVAASAVIGGLVGGTLAGFLQSRLLARNLRRGGWASWILISAGASVIGNLASSLLWTANVFTPVGAGLLGFYAVGLGATLLDGIVTAILAGIPLGRSFRRRCAPAPGGRQD
jgi:hypothetical protein